MAPTADRPSIERERTPLLSAVNHWATGGPNFVAIASCTHLRGRYTLRNTSQHTYPFHNGLAEALKADSKLLPSLSWPSGTGSRTVVFCPAGRGLDVC